MQACADAMLPRRYTYLGRATMPKPGTYARHYAAYVAYVACRYRAQIALRQ